MAAASTQKLHDIVECPICLETLAEPRMLACFHFYCQKCVHDMNEVKQNEIVGYACPLCRKFTAKDQLQNMPFVDQLLEATEQKRGGVDTLACGICTTCVPKQRCIDCKENYCDACRRYHDKVRLFRAHTWEAIDDATQPAVIDNIVFCGNICFVHRF